jgi:hypothetical protein
MLNGLASSHGKSEIACCGGVPLFVAREVLHPASIASILQDSACNVCVAGVLASLRFYRVVASGFWKKHESKGFHLRIGRRLDKAMLDALAILQVPFEFFICFWILTRIAFRHNVSIPAFHTSIIDQLPDTAEIIAMALRFASSSIRDIRDEVQTLTHIVPSFTLHAV